MSMKPHQTVTDPNPAWIKPGQKQAGGFAQGVLGGANPFAGMTSGLESAGGNAVQSFLGQGAPEQKAFEQMSPFLMAAMGGQANPYAGQGFTNPGQAVVDAAGTQFHGHLADSLAQLNNAAPGRFSSAHAAQGNGLAANALNDFNLFAAQALQQGQSLQQQQQAMNLNYQLGSQQNGLSAAGLYGNLAHTAGEAPFQRALSAGQLGLAQTQAHVNPLLQLMLQSMQFLTPAANNVTMGPSPFQQMTGLVGALGQAGVAAAGLK